MEPVARFPRPHLNLVYCKYFFLKEGGAVVASFACHLATITGCGIRFCIVLRLEVPAQPILC